MTVRGTLANQEAAVEADRYFLALFFFISSKVSIKIKVTKKQFQIKSIIICMFFCVYMIGFFF